MSVEKSVSAPPATRKKSAVAKKTAAPVPMKKAAAAPPATKKPARAPARPSREEALLARVEQVRLAQRTEGSFDCFGRAGEGYCDQGGCLYHAECMSVSQLLHSL
jgi:hypothetical protein